MFFFFFLNRIIEIVCMQRKEQVLKFCIFNYMHSNSSIKNYTSSRKMKHKQDKVTHFMKHHSSTLGDKFIYVKQETAGIF